jgi:hypothetical protein
MGMRVLAADLLRMSANRAPDKIRHDPGAVAAIAIELAQEGRRRKNSLARTKDKR